MCDCRVRKKVQREGNQRKSTNRRHLVVQCAIVEHKRRKKDKEKTIRENITNRRLSKKKVQTEDNQTKNYKQ